MGRERERNKRGGKGRERSEECEKEMDRCHVFTVVSAPRKAVGMGVKPAVSSRIQSRSTGGSKIGGGVSKTTPPSRQVKATAKPAAAKSTNNAASAAEIKALNEEVARLQDQVREYFLLLFRYMPPLLSFSFNFFL